MKKLLLIFALAVLTAVSASAQNDWFVSVGGGMNYSIEGVKTENMGSGWTPAVKVSVGKWYTPALGVQVSYDGYSLKNDKYFPDGIDCHFATLGLLVDLLNACGKDKNRVITIVPEAFAGAAFGNETCVACGIGLQIPVRIGKVVALVPEVKAMGVQDIVFKNQTGWNAVAQGSLNLRFSF